MKKINYSFNNYFSSMDIHFGHFIASLTNGNKEDLFLAAALVSRCVRDGHVCLDLNDLAGKIIFKSEGLNFNPTDQKNKIFCFFLIFSKINILLRSAR